jgi:uncharacterized glyoxalase superfamily protein PhnB
MELKALTVNLMVDDVQRSVDFYNKNFGFEVLATVPGEDELIFAMIKCDFVTIMLQSMRSFAEANPEYKNAAVGGTILLYIDVSGIRLYYEKVKKAGIPLVKDLHETFYGTTEFCFKDPDGYLVSFAEDKSEPA